MSGCEIPSGSLDDWDERRSERATSPTVIIEVGDAATEGLP